MWVKRSIDASRVFARRFVPLLAITSFMAVLAVTGPLSSVASAAEAIWSGTTLTYDGKVHSPATAPPDRPGEPMEYEWQLNTGGPTVASVLYFGEDPGNKKKATLVEYDVLNGNYTQSKPPQTVSVVRDLTVDDQDTAEANLETTCNVTGIGWIICPIASWMSDGVDWVYGIVEGFLEVQTITKSDSGVYQIWELIRNIANICFLLVFIAIVYSQLTGIGYSNHNIKDMIPRLVIGAALVNVSFWICAIAVDASNLLGYSIQSIFVTVRENIIMTPAISGANFTWAGITAVILGGGYAGLAGFGAAAGGSGISLSFLLMAALMPAAFAILVAFIILAARQALIVVLTMISPLAFVAMVLPSTQGLFDKWRKTFTTLLIFFPIFAFVFGGSQLAGTAILNSSADAQPSMQLPIILIGMATIVVPLVITPLLIRFSSGLLGQIANFANSKNRGLVDRAQNWARDNAEVHKGKKLAKVDRDLVRRQRGELGFFNPRGRGVGRLGLRYDQQKRKRDAIKALNEEALAARHDENWKRSLHSPAPPRGVREALGMESAEQFLHDVHDRADIRKRKAKSYEDRHHAHSDRKWSEYLDDTDGVRGDGRGAYFRQLQKETSLDKGVSDQYNKTMADEDDLALKSLIKRDATLREVRSRGYDSSKKAEDIDKGMTAHDEKTYQKAVNKNTDYADIRRTRKQAVIDTEMAQFEASEVEAEGKREYRRLFEDGQPGSRDLRKQNVRIEQLKKETGEVEGILQARADASWEGNSRHDPYLQQLRLKKAVATDKHKLAEVKWNKFIEQARSKGSDAPSVAAGNEELADSMQNLMVSVSAHESAIENVKDEQKSHLLQQLNESAMLQQVAGGGTKYGTTKVLAKTQSSLTQMLLENAKAMTSIYSNDGYSVDEMFKAMNPDGVLRGGKPADDVAKFAAIQHVMENIGNNWAVEKTIDRMIREHGMFVEKDDEGNAITDDAGVPIYYDAQDYFENGTNARRLDNSEVSSRRDTLQMVVDGYRKGKNKVSWMSATMQESLNRGITNVLPPVASQFGPDIDASAAAIIGEARAGKYEGNRIATMDPDELARMVQLFRKKEFREALTPKQRENIIQAVNKAQSSEQTRHMIKDRERGLMNAVANWLELGENDNPPSRDAERELENIYYEEEHRDGDEVYTVRVPRGTPDAKRVWADAAAPNFYNPDRQDDIRPSGVGLYDPSGPEKRPNEMP